MKFFFHRTFKFYEFDIQQIILNVIESKCKKLYCYGKLFMVIKKYTIFNLDKNLNTPSIENNYSVIY